MLMLSCINTNNTLPYSFRTPRNFTLKANKVSATDLSLPPLKKKAADVSPLLKGSSIFLLGFKTSLKTNLGKLLADVLRYYYFDSDNLVEEAIGGASAAKSFRESDEKGFYESEIEEKMKTLLVETTTLLSSSNWNWKWNWNTNPPCSVVVSFKTRKTPIAAVTTNTTRTLKTHTPQPQSQKKKKKRVFFLDVNPLCYEGSKPNMHSFARWLTLFLSQVTHTDLVIAVIDGERGSEHRRKLLPSYKAHRQKFMRHLSSLPNISRGHVGRFHQVNHDVLGKCNVPVIKVDGHEADDVIATLTEQVLNKGFRVVIASPDKDFKQLISDDVQIVVPLPELKRWSFYTLRHYQDQYNCDPRSDLSLRCIIGDEVDGVPGIQHLVPGFGRNTALKLIKKHGSLETLLNAAAVRTVGRPYAQDALQKYADYLRRNYEVLALKRDVNVQLYEEWLVDRDTHNDPIALSTLFKYLEERKEYTHRPQPL